MNMLFALVIALCMFSTHAEGKKLTGREKSECVNKLLEWCKGMKYSKGNTQILHNSYQDNDSQFEVSCSTDSKGTKCKRDEKPWFRCSKDHVVFYKGKKMSKGMTKVDNGICKAGKAVNEYFMTEEEQGSFSEDMRSLHEDLKRMKENLKKIGDHVMD